MIDLHCHSTASDGSMSPTELLQHARERGLSTIAVTDHDTMDGLDEASAAAATQNITLINGIEIEAAWDAAGVFHVLGLGFDRKAPSMLNLMPVIQNLRTARNRTILDHMAEHGIHAQMSDILAEGDGSVITRPHFADYLVKIGLVKNRKDAFDTYLTPGKPFFEKYMGLPVADIVAAVHQAGGKVVVAHPLSLYVSWTRLEKMTGEWKEIGVDGIESWHPTASWRDAARLDAFATTAGLRRSAGSDFHGKHRPDRILGKTLEERHTIDDSFLSLFD